MFKLHHYQNASIQDRLIQCRKDPMQVSHSHMDVDKDTFPLTLFLMVNLLGVPYFRLHLIDPGSCLNHIYKWKTIIPYFILLLPSTGQANKCCYWFSQKKEHLTTISQFQCFREDLSDHKDKDYKFHVHQCQAHLTFHWRSPEPHLTIIWPSPDPYKTLT